MDHESALVISDAGDAIVLRPLGRTHPGCIDYWDGNWLRTQIELRAGGIQGKIATDRRTDELAAFRDQLHAVYADLSGEARLVSLEDGIDLRAVGDGRGPLRAGPPKLRRCLYVNLHFVDTVHEDR